MVRKEEMGRQKLWEILTSQAWQVESPVFPDLALGRILVSSGNESLNLFTPWGPPYNKKGFDLGKSPEVKSIKKLAAIAKLFATYGVSINWIFLGADIYGTEINRLGNLNGPPRIKEDIVERYFFNLKRPILIYISEARLYLWSQIRSQYNAIYLLSRQEYSDERIKQLVGKIAFRQIARTARLINHLSSKEEAEVMALRYLRERTCEALLVEKIWHPIKISLAPRQRDEIIDMRLPRLYLIPPKLQTPWLTIS